MFSLHMFFTNPNPPVVSNSLKGLGRPRLAYHTTLVHTFTSRKSEQMSPQRVSHRHDNTSGFGSRKRTLGLARQMEGWELGNLEETEEATASYRARCLEALARGRTVPLGDTPGKKTCWRFVNVSFDGSHAPLSTNMEHRRSPARRLRIQVRPPDVRQVADGPPPGNFHDHTRCVFDQDGPRPFSDCLLCTRASMAAKELSPSNLVVGLLVGLTRATRS